MINPIKDLIDVFQSGDDEQKKKRLAQKTGPDALEAYEELASEGVEPEEMPPRLLDQVGNMHRDLGNPAKAIALYTAAAEGYLREDAWTGAAHLVRKAEEMQGERDVRLWRLNLQVALGRGEPDRAARCLEALGERLRPSDGAEIDRLVEIIDQESFGEPAVDAALAELLAALGRTRWAVERYETAIENARRRGQGDVADDLDRRLEVAGFRDDVGAPGATEGGDSGPQRSAAEAGNADPAAASSSRAVQASFADLAEAVRRGAATEARTRFVGTDARLEESEEAEVRELMEQLKAGIREVVPEDEVVTHYELALGYLQMEMYGEAVDAFQKAFRSPALRVRAAEGLTQALLGQGDPLLARRTASVVLEESVEEEADAIGLLYWKGRAAEARGAVDEAVDLYERVCVHDRHFEDAHERLYALMGD